MPRNDSVLSKKKVAMEHLKYAYERGMEKTYCPSEVARSIFPNEWRKQMDLVRQVADELVASGELVTMQFGEIISQKPSMAKGPIRLRKLK